jgi:quercetin 2,3-dioxygenase
MMQVRRSDERGHADHGWLDTYHTFSFADYHDSRFMGFRDLRVINEDRVQPGRGFAAHSHRDMEILTYVVDGALEHKDSMGTGSVIRPGDVQRMSAGRGVAHSEYNHSDREPVHLLQIWILPAEDGIEPSYEQKHFAPSERKGQLRLVASGDARQGSIRIHQDADLYATILDGRERLRHELRPGRAAWLQLVRGELSVNGETVRAGDGIALADEAAVDIAARAASEALLFDLA